MNASLLQLIAANVQGPKAFLSRVANAGAESRIVGEAHNGTIANSELDGWVMLGT